MLHPNDVDLFYNIVTNIYCSPMINTLDHDLFFFCVKKDLVNTFSFFSKIGKNRDGVRFTVHFTKIASESSINFDLKYF